MITEVGKSIFLKGQPCPHPKGRGGAGPKRPNNFWEYTCAHIQYEKQPNFAILHSNNDVNKNLQCRPAMLTRDVSAVANLVLN